MVVIFVQATLLESPAHVRVSEDLGPSPLTPELMQMVQLIVDRVRASGDEFSTL